jgi:phosphopantetheine adenylyltransferase
MFAPGHRNFHPVDEGHTVLLRDAARLIQTVHVVVIGQRQHFNAPLMRAVDHVSRRQGAIGNV